MSGNVLVMRGRGEDDIFRWRSWRQRLHRGRGLMANGVSHRGRRDCVMKAARRNLFGHNKFEANPSVVISQFRWRQTGDQVSIGELAVIR